VVCGYDKKEYVLKSFKPQNRKYGRESEASAKKGGLLCGGNRLAQRVRRRCSSAAEAGF
jgi:hypothetical protein